MTIPNDIMTEYFSTSKLLNRPFDDCLEFDNNGIIIDDFKHKINDPTLNIQDSKIIGNPEDKFETMLFLPNNHERKGEGGLRTKGYFKHSYKYIKNDCKNNNKIIPHENKIETGDWYIIDSNDKPLKLASTEIQQKIANYISNIKVGKDNSIKTTTPENIVYLPLISVITVVYNGAKYLEETILSILNQSYPNIEYIIIDGGSTDGTLDIIKKYENYIDYWISEKDEGIYDAMNKGIDLVKGEWINFMNAGDKFYNEYTIENIFLENKKYNNAYIVYGDVQTDYGNFKAIIKAGNLNNLNKGMQFSHQSTFFKREYHLINKYNLKYKISSDYFNILSCYLKYPHKLIYTNNTISVVNIEGVSEKNILRLITEYRDILKYFQVNTLKTDIYYTIESLKQWIKIKFIPDKLLQKYRKIKRSKVIK